MIQLKNRIFLLTAFMLIGFPLNAQLTLLKSYVINESQVAAVDYIGNYYVQNNNELWMFNRADTVFRKFSIISLSDVTNIDASNALKIQLYYKELGKIIYIDNNRYYKTLHEK